MLLLIDCKYKLEERPDVRKLFKVTSPPPPQQGGPEEKETLLTNKEENGITATSDNGELRDNNVELQIDHTETGKDKQVSLC